MKTGEEEEIIINADKKSKNKLKLMGFLALAIVALPILFFVILWWSVSPEKVAEEYLDKITFETTVGVGQVEILPGYLPANSAENEIQLTYTAEAGGLAEGGGFRFYLPSQVVDYPGGSSIETLMLNNWWLTLNPFMYLKGFYEIEAPSGLRVEVKDVGVAKILRVGTAFFKSNYAREPVFNLKDLFRAISRVEVRIVEGTLQEGQSITVTIGSGGRLNTPHYPTMIDIAVESDSSGNGDFALISDIPQLITYSSAKGLDIFAPSTPRPGENIEVTVQSRTIEIYPQTDPFYTATVEIEAEGGEGVEVPREVEIMPEGKGQASFTARFDEEGIYYIRGIDRERGFEAISNPIIVRAEGPRLYWGDIHLHCILGDGDWKPEDVFVHARDIRKLDFATISEHDLNVVTTQMVMDKDLSALPGVRHQEEKWLYLENMASSFNEPGRFVTLDGYEWTSHQWGHRNIYFKPGTGTSYPNNIDPPTETVDGLLGYFEDKDVVIKPHHTAWRGARGQGEVIDWGDEEFSRQKLVEVFSQHGASEYYGNPFPMHAESIMYMTLPRGTPESGIPGKGVPWYIPIKGYQPTDASPPDRGNYVQEALAKGLKLTLVASSDAHYGSSTRMSYPSGLMAAWAVDLTDEEIWDAMDNRLVYGTTGSRIFMEFFVDGKPMGSDVKSTGKLEIRGMVIGESPLEKVEIVRYDGENYSVPYERSPGKRDFKIVFDDDFSVNESFYYLRVTQEDGNMGWAGPVWVYKKQ